MIDYKSDRDIQQSGVTLWAALVFIGLAAAFGVPLAKPALTVGKGAVSLVVELFTIFVLVLLLLLEGPKMWSWTLGQMTPGRGATVTRIAGDVSQKVTGYMFGDLLTSLIAGTVVFVTLLILGVPFR